MLACAFRQSQAPDVDRQGASAEPSSLPSSPPPDIGLSDTTELNNILFIIDASGSMKAKAGATSRMEAAKQVITDLVGDLPAGVNAGLMAYGHRQKSDCRDVELLLPVGPIQKEVFAEKVAALQPLGQTPISFSIREAANVLKNVKGKRSIILISDGEETCKDDPCAVAAELKKADIDLKIHVVGFGLDSAAAKRQLHCIADATGGVFAEAEDAAELKEKITDAAQAEITTGSTGKFTVLIPDMDGSPLKYGIKFHRPGATETDEPLNPTLDLGIRPTDTFHDLDVPPGVYDIEFSTLPYVTVWKRNVEVKAGQETHIEFPRFGRVRISIKDQNGNNVNMWTEIHDGTPEEKDLTGDHRFKETIDLPPGTYDLKFWGGGAGEVWQKGVVVSSGRETSLNLNVTVTD
jgi:hypothetical protein